MEINEKIALENMGGKKSLLIAILSYALELEEERWSEIEDAYLHEDYERYEIKAHALKGAMGCIGLEDLSAFSYQQELACSLGKHDQVKTNHPQLKELYTQSHRCIERYLNKLNHETVQ
ncbi:MAG: hypothetical protein Q4D51_02455 [Eubacteriales bacterium]|nr:hypothetical protein [Eubacteriales bacterium]